MTDCPVSTLTAGDDWQLEFSVVYPDGTPFNLTGAPVILWTLVDKTGKQAIASSEATVSITDALNGECSIHVGSHVTTRLKNDIYGHALRIVAGGVTATPFHGELYILADPWGTFAVSTTQILKFVPTNRKSLVKAA
jgi:hypothetical protein